MANKSMEAVYLERLIASLSSQVNQLERILNGEPITEVKIAEASITSAKIADLAVTDAKIDSLTASKITAGTLEVVVGIGEQGSSFIRANGEEGRIESHDGTTYRIAIGEV